MTIKVVHDKGEFEVAKKDFKESMKRLEGLLEPGIPMMVEEKSWTDLSMGYRGTDRHLFFSDGKILDGNKLVSRNGKRNRAFAMCSGENNNFQSYQLVTRTDPNLESAKLSVPSFWTMKQFNEGTFSPAGPVEWESCHSGGTSLVMIGKKVEEQFSEALDAVRFVEKGIAFELNPFYSMPGYLITTNGLNREENDLREREASKLVGVAAVKKLAEQASRELCDKKKMERPYEALLSTQLGWWRSGSKPSRDDGYPVNDRDYLLYELSHPGRRVAFVKVGEGICYGNIFVLPCKGAERVVDLALSKEFVREYFPVGIKDDPRS